MKKRYPSSSILFLLLFVIFFNCKENNVKKEAIEKEQIKPFLKTPPKDAVTYHEDTTKEYEYRTGTSGDYTYNYNAYGFDIDGNEIEIDVEWIGYGKLLATDEEGNEYELTVDEK